MCAESAIREVVGNSKMDFALYEGREQIAKQTEQLMQQMLDRYQTGVFVQKVTLQNVQPPDKVQAAFDDAVKAGQDRERLKNEGQAYANDVVPRARGPERHRPSGEVLAEIADLVKPPNGLRLPSRPASSDVTIVPPYPA